MLLPMMSRSRDVEYEKKKALQLKRKQGPSQKQFSASASITSPPPDSSSDSDMTEEADVDVDEPNISKKPRRDKKSEFVTVNLPRNLINSPEVTAALDRTGTSNNAAMEIFSSLL